MGTCIFSSARPRFAFPIASTELIRSSELMIRECDCRAKVKGRNPRTQAVPTAWHAYSVHRWCLTSSETCMSGVPPAHSVFFKFFRFSPATAIGST